MTYTLHHGDALDVLREMPAASVDSIVTDPPYGLRFMGKKWDHDVPGADFWREALRVLKPGGHCLAFAGTRTQHRMAVNIEDAGFEIRDLIAWVYGTGFPKSHNLPGGFGTALKPALEPVTVARKPLVGTVAENVRAHGTGALNIDGCRVEITGPAGVWGAKQNASLGYHGGTEASGFLTARHELGRWPANLIHDGSEEVVGLFPETGKSPGTYVRAVTARGEWLHAKLAGSVQIGHGDSGSASRFFYCAKATKRERDGSKHPTVKPVALMRYLCRLVTPPGGVVLDPFAGTGTTLQAALEEGFRALGIEREAEYIADIERRMTRVQPGLVAAE